MNITTKVGVITGLFMVAGILVNQTNLFIPFDQEDLTFAFYLVKYSINAMFLLAYITLVSKVILKVNK